MFNVLICQNPPIILLKDGTENTQGKAQVISNITACQAVAEAVRTTLGPRGMDKMIFVDQNFKAVKVIKANLNQLDLMSQAEVYKNNADRALKALAKREIQFDIILLDPPYKKGLIDEAIERISEFNLLKENGIIVCEFSHNEEITIAPFQMIKRYHYGLTDTLLLEKGE